MSAYKEKTYLVLNYCSNPVSIKTRYDSYILDACKEGKPSSIPLSLDEIHQVDNNCKHFRTGHLRFEPENEEMLYDELRIRDWKDILTNEQIEDIISNPTTESLEKILTIDEPRYFNRIYGIYIGMRNAGYSISKKVDIVMTSRYKELVNHRRKTGIQLAKKEDKVDTDLNALREENASIKEQNQEMQNQLIEMQKMMEQLKSMIVDSSANSASNVCDSNDLKVTKTAPKNNKASKSKTV